MTTKQKVQEGYLPPALQLISVDTENLILMASASATTEDIFDFEIGYDD